MTLIVRALLITAAFSTTAAHAETWLRCDTCSETAAQTMAAQSGPNQEIVIFSMQGTARAFFTETEVVGENCQPRHQGSAPGAKPGTKPSLPATQRAGDCQSQTVANPTPLTADKATLASLIQGTYVETNGTMKTVLTVDLENIPGAQQGSGPVANDPNGLTAYDIANNVYVQGNLGRAIKDYIASLDSQISQFANIVLNAVSVHILGTEFQINLIVRLPDGSTVQYDLTSQSPNAEFIKARDPLGNEVMLLGDNPAAFQGTTTFPMDQDANNFLSNAELNGVRVVRSSGRIGNTTRCTWDQESGTLTCHQQ